METTKFSQDVQEYAKTMGERLKNSQEGSMIIIAADNNNVVTASLATRKQKRDLFIALLQDDDTRQVLEEYADEQ